MEVTHKHSREIDRSAWDEWVRQSPQGTVYALSGYLDAVAPEWEALIAAKDGKWMGIMPLFPKSKGFLKLNLQPPFCQHTGTLLKAIQGDSNYKLYRIKKDIVEALVDNLPFYHYTDLQLHPDFDYPLPFYWQGFQLNTHFTYQLDIRKLPLVGQLRPNLKRTIQKAEDQNWHLEPIQDTETFQEFVTGQLNKHKVILGPTEKQALAAVTQYLLEQRAGWVTGVRDQAGTLRAMALFGCFKHTLYFLASASDEKGRQGGAMAFLIWQTLQEYHGHYQIFDFEGSMIPDIEHFFRGFGAQPVPFLRVTKNQLPLSPLWKMFGF